MIRSFRSLVRHLIPAASSKVGEESSPTTASTESSANRLERLLEMWKETQDPEEEILLATEALDVDQEIEDWSLSAPRDVVRGALFNNLGGAFLKLNKGSRADNVECSIAAFEAALHFRPRDELPEEWGQTQSDLGHAYSERIHGDRAENLEQAIAAYHTALTVLTTELSPRSWATTQNNLGLAYADRIRGSRAENLEVAIAACEAALTVRTRDALPEEWAQSQNNLALALAGRIHGDKAQNLEQAIAGYERALTVITHESSLQAWIRIQNNLGIAYVDRIHGDRTENLEKSIAVHEKSLEFVSPQTLPKDWALIQNNLALAYTNRTIGAPADNLERARGHLEAALTVYTLSDYPEDWAMVHFNLAANYSKRIRGDRVENLEHAIAANTKALTVYTREGFPQRWAATLSNLGLVYLDRPRGERADNIDAAINHFQESLTVYSRAEFPKDWGEALLNMGIAYSSRMGGDRAENLESGIASYRQALEVLTREAFPREWSAVQNNLANVYVARIRGERADNLERAIAAIEATLTVRTAESFPMDWGQSQNNLASAYADRIRGDPAENMEKAILHFGAAVAHFAETGLPEELARAQENLGICYIDRIRGERAENVETAIANLNAALDYFKRPDFPQQWAHIQNSLGIAYWRRVRAKRASNLEKAIAHYEAALAVRTKNALPNLWAMTQHNLGLVYGERIKGIRADNLDKAISAFEAALTVHTRDGFPRDYLVTARLLGATFLERANWRGALQALQGAREAFLILFGQGLEDAEARDLVKQSGQLFSEAAYAAAQLGDAATAFELLNEGKARLMAVALRLQALDLASDNRGRLDSLRGQIREAGRTLDAATGLERTATLETLAKLRSDLLVLVGLAVSGDRADRTALGDAIVLTAAGGMVAAPIVTAVGGMMLVIAPRQGGPSINMLDLPALTTARLEEFLVGPAGAAQIGGWLGTFNIQYLPAAERDARTHEWLSAIDGLGPDLWRLVGGTLQQELIRCGVKPGAHLIWLPTDSLGLLPIGLAQDPTTGTRLGDLHPICYAPSIEALATAARRLASPSKPTLTAVLNPTEDLEFTEIEGRLVAGNFEPGQSTLIERKNATPTATLAALKESNYWHFASHGTFSWDDARLSALLLHNAALTVGELLEAQGLARPRLVVLSACETGLYDTRHSPDEFIGLPGAFIAIGAAGVLSTLWQVDDRATALLIARFYDLHLGEGLAPQTALQQAQHWLRSTTRKQFIAYASAAVTDGRIADASMGAQLQTSLSRATYGHTRFASIWAWLNTKIKAGTPEETAEADPDEKPFAHPYFWGSFVHVGL